VTRPTAAHLTKVRRLTRQAWRETATGGLRMMPGLIVVGAQKAGTTSLHFFLAQHPDVAASRVKEVQYFDIADRFARGPAWYRSQFPVRTPGKPRRVAFETTPNYLFHAAVPGRIHALLPEVRVIAVLRDPVERAVSSYLHQVRKGREHLSLEDAIAAEPERIGPSLAVGDYDSAEVRHYSYLARGHYAEQLERFYALFPRGQILVLRSEDLFEHPDAISAEITRFLGISAMPIPGFPRMNAAGPGSLDVPARVTNRMYEHFAPHNAALGVLLGRDLRWRPR
jgi:hypothetical protein